jgi:hypothetical protein
MIAKKTKRAATKKAASTPEQIRTEGFRARMAERSSV